MRLGMSKRAHVESRFEYKGYPCVVILMWHGHRCGYVGIKNFLGKGLEEARKLRLIQYYDIECHGGITYRDTTLFGQDDKNTYWIGFDCAHWQDLPDVGKMIEVFGDTANLEFAKRELSERRVIGKIWTKEDVEAECRKIVDQLIEYEEGKR